MINHHRYGFIILTVGRLHPVKDHVFLLRACGELKQRSLPFLCIIIGEGQTRKTLNILIKRMKLAREVKILGFMDQGFLNAFYQMADLFVLTSKSEGLPLTLMESMLNKSIVLVPKITGIPEVVRDGENGFLYQGGDLENFVDKILFIYENRDSLRAIGEQARNQICTNFDRRKNMEAFADVFISRLALVSQ